MAKNSIQVNSDNITEWMASTGFLFPRTPLELARFDKLYGDEVEDIEGCRVDPNIIISGKSQSRIVGIFDIKVPPQPSMLRMAARKGEGSIPDHIISKIKKNQEKGKSNDNGS